MTIDRWPMNFTDSHNHLQRFDDPARTIAEMRAAGVSGCVVNGTCEDDWPQVAALAEAFPDFILPAFGLHPWQAHLRSPDWLKKLTALLDRFPHASIGECGLDGWVASPPLELQREAFLPQISLARERSLPLTIHALKAWQPLLDALAEEPPPARGFLLHSFGGSPGLARRLAAMGAYFSFSGHFLHPRKAKILETFRTIPRDRLLIETDAPDMLPPESHISHPLPENRNHPANLPLIAAALASALGLPTKDLADLTTRNHTHLFAPPKNH